MQSRHGSILAQKIIARRQELFEAIGTSVFSDVGAYRHIVGQIQGLSDALKLSEDVDFETSGGA